ncbi:MAG: nucleoside-diphosphate sugar epimerase/dehydratase, partial [Persicimonas sp.]
MKKSTDWFLELPSLPRGVRVTLIAGFHLIVFAAAFVGAYAIRFDFQIPASHAETMFAILPIVLAVKLAVFLAMGMFRGWWRYVSLHDVIALARALVVATGVFIAVNVFVAAPSGFPRSIYILDFGLAFLGLGAARGSLRLLREAMRSNIASSEDSKRLLILGAGDTGETLVREINKNKNLPFRPIAFLDDDPYRHKLRIHGVPVLGSCELIEDVVNAHEIEQIIIAMPSASRDQLRAIYERARKTDAEVKILPALE